MTLVAYGLMNVVCAECRPVVTSALLYVAVSSFDDQLHSLPRKQF